MKSSRGLRDGGGDVENKASARGSAVSGDAGLTVTTRSILGSNTLSVLHGLAKSNKTTQLLSMTDKSAQSSSSALTCATESLQSCFPKF
jgi:hypothetical protein